MSSLIKRAPTDNLLALVEPVLKSPKSPKKPSSWSTFFDESIDDNVLTPTTKVGSCRVIGRGSRKNKKEKLLERGRFVVDFVEEIIKEEARRKKSKEHKEEEYLGTFIVSDFEDKIPSIESIRHSQDEKAVHPDQESTTKSQSPSEEFFQMALCLQSIQITSDEN